MRPAYRSDLPEGGFAAEQPRYRGIPSWQEIEERLAKMSEISRERCSAPGITERDADFHRGMLAACREILGMPRETHATMGADAGKRSSAAP